MIGRRLLYSIPAPVQREGSSTALAAVPTAVYGLVMKLRDCDFSSAVEWLSARLRVPLPAGERARPLDPRQVGLEFAYEVFSHRTPSEQDRLKGFAVQRGYEAGS